MAPWDYICKKDNINKEKKENLANVFPPLKEFIKANASILFCKKYL